MLSKIYFIVLLFLVPSICMSQNSKLKFKNNYEYKYSLYKEKLPTTFKQEYSISCNSLEDCLQKFQFSSIENNRSELEKAMSNLAKYFIAQKKILVLTYGTNGSGGLGMHKLDKVTKKYDFIFLSVENSCILGNIPYEIKVFNSEVSKYLDAKIGASWKNELIKKLRRKGYKSKKINYYFKDLFKE